METKKDGPITLNKNQGKKAPKKGTIYYNFYPGKLESPNNELGELLPPRDLHQFISGVSYDLFVGLSQIDDLEFENNVNKWYYTSGNTGAEIDINIQYLSEPKISLRILYVRESNYLQVAKRKHRKKMGIVEFSLHTDLSNELKALKETDEKEYSNKVASLMVRGILQVIKKIREADLVDIEYELNKINRSLDMRQ